MEQVRPEVFRGHLDECWQHFTAAVYAAAPKGSPRMREMIVPMTEFCGVTLKTILRWLYGNGTDQMPTGLTHFKLMAFLDMLGYRVIELENLNATLRGVLELLAYDVVSVELLNKRTGVESVSCNYISTVIRGLQRPSEARMRALWDLWKEHKGALETAKHTQRQKYPPLAQFLGRAVVPAARAAAKDAVPQSDTSQAVKSAESSLVLQADARIILNLSSALVLVLDAYPAAEMSPRTLTALRQASSLPKLIGQLALVQARLMDVQN